VDVLKYQSTKPEILGRLSQAASSGEVMILKLRYKEPDADISSLLQALLKVSKTDWKKSSDNFRFSSSVAVFGMILRDSPHRGKSSYQLIQSLVEQTLDSDPEGYRREFLRLVQTAEELTSERR